MSTMVTPRVTEVPTPAMLAHAAQRALVAASIMAVPAHATDARDTLPRS